MLDIKTTLEQNNKSDRLTIPFVAKVTCQQILNAPEVFEIPIKASYTGMKKTYSVDIAGFRLNTEHINSIPALVNRLIEGLVKQGHLPSYVFIARDAGVVYPVYLRNQEVYVPTPYGPLFKHVELAVVRSKLSDYLHEIKVLGAKGRTDKFHVRGVDSVTMQLSRPRLYLKKRIDGEPDFWAPVFKSSDGTELYTHAANAKRSVPVVDGSEVLALQKVVAQVLHDDKRLSDANDLRPDRMFAGLWERLVASTLTDTGDVLSINGKSIPVYTTAEGSIVGLEFRSNEERYSIYLGDTVEDMRQRAEADLTRRGF